MRRVDWRRVLIWSAVGAALAYLIWRVRGFVMALLASIVLYYFLRPAVEALCRLKIPRLFSVVAVFVALGGAVVAFGRYAIPPIVGELKEASHRIQGLKKDLPGLIARFRKVYRFLPEEVQRAVEGRAYKAADRAISYVFSVAGKLADITARSIAFLVLALLVPVMTFYFLADPGRIKQAFLGWLSPKYSGHAERILSSVDRIFGAYIVGQFILCLIAFVVVTLILYAFEVKFYLVLGLMAGVARAIPIIGPIVSGIPIVLVAWLNSPLCALEVLVLFSLLHFVESKFIMPVLIGHEVGLHPVEVIVALLVAEEFFGIVGMFFAAPIVAATKALVQSKYASAGAGSCNESA